MIGLFDRFVPKFAKQYATVSKSILAAFNNYAEEVASSRFPGPEHSFTMKDEVLKRLY